MVRPGTYSECKAPPWHEPEPTKRHNTSLRLNHEPYRRSAKKENAYEMKECIETKFKSFKCIIQKLESEKILDGFKMRHKLMTYSIIL